MIAYVDSSVILRFVLQQPDTLTALLDFDERVTSFLAEVECMRAIEAARLLRRLSTDESGERRQLAYKHLRRMRRLMPSLSILRRAGEPYPVALKTLDAVHLATALTWRDRRAPDLVFATHDHQLGRAALALDFEVIGL
ncbi:MAG: type II toxin-antitoxin system VapC family toxin [Actinobacteria bacterium]|nr:type II toxin-antitoxin system VapC family toxin [Actinomycetota bacterium]